MEANQPVVHVQNLTFTYPQRTRPALVGVDLAVTAGEFVVLCGQSGSGKTTLLRQLKPSLAPHGRTSGSVLFRGCAAAGLSDREAATEIGYVQQNPDNQTVTDKVWHELAFGLESLGHDTPTIRLRVAEMASFFGIQEWFERDVSELSGGQKQLLALASVMAMQPSLLLLDEPTSQLDAIAAADFLAAVGKVNRELGVTVILTEQRLEEALPQADRCVVMDQGKIVCDGAVAEVGRKLRDMRHAMFAAMPVPMRVWAGIESDLDCPVTIRDGRTWLAQATGGLELRLAPSAATGLRDDVPAMELDEVWFRYGRELPDVIKGLSFKAWHGEVTCILGGNATGKTTTLSLIAGAAKPWRGTVRLDGRKLGDLPKSELFDHLLGVMPQNPQALFVSKSVRDELLDALSSTSLPKSERREALGGIVGLCRLEGLLESHPYDLSGGEQQRVALAKILLLKPTILLLDEPTKGMDAQFKLVFADILHSLAKSGVAVVMVSHDMEFCASHADRCALFFNGAIVSENAPRPFFSGNSFYTSAANRMARDILPAAVTAEDLIEALGGGLEEPGSGGSDDGGGGGDAGDAGDAGGDAGDGGVADGGGSDAGGGGGGDGRAVSPKPPQDAAGSGSGGSDANDAIDAINAIDADDKSHAASLPLEGALRQKLPRRTVAAAVMILLAVPFTIFAGMYFLEDRRYFFISVAIIIETMVPFALIFEGRKPQARELVVIAVLCAIGVAGRTVFFMLPQFKPLVAMVIIAGVSFGGETGFLVGAMSFFVSDMFFGQGPWTPWQMFAGGLIGFLAGVLLKKGLLSRRRLALCAFGGLATVLIYGGLMNPASVLTFFSEPTAPLIVSAYVQGLPFDLLHAASTVAVLAIAAKPMLEKLDRIKAKYGLVER